MNTTEIKALRKKQFIVTNIHFVIIFVLYFTIINFIHVKISTQFLILGIIMLTMSITTLMKGYSTKSFIPIYEQVAIYEKEKMGKEWIKQRKSSRISNLILSGLFFYQYFLNRNSSTIFEINLVFISGLLLILLIAINISMLLQFSKVDRKTSESDFKGYTRDLWILSIVLGIIMAVLIFMYVFIFIFLKV